MSILTDEPPAPEAVNEISLCNCKTDCSTMRWKCKKNSLVCPGMCLCTGCKNVPAEDLECPIVHDDDDEDNECKIR